MRDCFVGGIISWASDPQLTNKNAVLKFIDPQATDKILQLLKTKSFNNICYLYSKDIFNKVSNKVTETIIGEQYK